MYSNVSNELVCFLFFVFFFNTKYDFTKDMICKFGTQATKMALGLYYTSLDKLLWQGMELGIRSQILGSFPLLHLGTLMPHCKSFKVPHFPKTCSVSRQLLPQLNVAYIYVILLLFIFFKATARCHDSNYHSLFLPVVPNT